MDAGVFGVIWALFFRPQFVKQISNIPNVYCEAQKLVIGIDSAYPYAYWTLLAEHPMLLFW